MRLIKSDEVPMDALIAWDKAKGLFPRYSPSQLKDLNDYRTIHGEDSILPLTVSVDHRIVDGYNRYQAALERGQEMIEVNIYAYKDETEMLIHAIVLNAKRRHLDSVYAARAADMLAELYRPKDEETKKKCAEAGAKGGKGNKGSTTPMVHPLKRESALDKAAKEVGVNPDTVRQVKKIDATGDKELIEAVENKDIPINVGAKLAGVSDADARHEALRSELYKRAEKVFQTASAIRQVGAEHYIAGCIDAQLKLEEGRKRTTLESLDNSQLRRCMESLASLATHVAMMKQELDSTINKKQHKELD